MPPGFIAIDDDRIDNMISSKIVQQTVPGADVKTFIDPEAGLEYIQSLPISDSKKQVLFLDINMPTLTGWEVLERFKSYPENLQRQFSIYILSSSVSPKDKELADNEPLVLGFIQKPITTARIQEILASS